MLLGGDKRIGEVLKRCVRLESRDEDCARHWRKTQSVPWFAALRGNAPRCCSGVVAILVAHLLRSSTKRKDLLGRREKIRRQRSRDTVAINNKPRTQHSAESERPTLKPLTRMNSCPLPPPHTHTVNPQPAKISPEQVPALGSRDILQVSRESKRSRKRGFGDISAASRNC